MKIRLRQLLNYADKLGVEISINYDPEEKYAPSFLVTKGEHWVWYDMLKFFRYPGLIYKDMRYFSNNVDG